MTKIKKISTLIYCWWLWEDWCWEGLGAGGEGDDRGWDGWMASLTWWMWVWVNSGRWWWTGRPGVLQFMGSHRVGHDWATELMQNDIEYFGNQGFPCGSVGKESACNAGDLGSVPGLGRSPGEGNGYPLQYSGLENSMDLYSPWGRKESDTTEWLSLHLMVSYKVKHILTIKSYVSHFYVVIEERWELMATLKLVP